MSKVSHWEIARNAKIMGIKTTMVLDPTQITIRVKNNAKRMLRLGRIRGDGNAANVADLIRKKFDLPVSRDWWRGMHIGNVSVDVKQQLLGVVQADWASETLENPGYTQQTYYRNRHKEQVISLQSPTAKNFNIAFHQVAFYEQAAAVMAASLTEKDKQAIEDAIVYLDVADPIHITVY
jgi:hypothetical protein